MCCWCCCDVSGPCYCICWCTIVSHLYWVWRQSGPQQHFKPVSMLSDLTYFYEYWCGICALSESMDKKLKLGYSLFGVAPFLLPSWASGRQISLLRRGLTGNKNTGSLAEASNFCHSTTRHREGILLQGESLQIQKAPVWLFTSPIHLL